MFTMLKLFGTNISDASYEFVKMMQNQFTDKNLKMLKKYINSGEMDKALKRDEASFKILLNVLTQRKDFKNIDENNEAGSEENRKVSLKENSLEFPREKLSNFPREKLSNFPREKLSNFPREHDSVQKEKRQVSLKTLKEFEEVKRAKKKLGESKKETMIFAEEFKKRYKKNIENSSLSDNERRNTNKEIEELTDKIKISHGGLLKKRLSEEQNDILSIEQLRKQNKIQEEIAKEMANKLTGLSYYCNRLFEIFFGKEEGYFMREYI